MGIFNRHRHLRPEILSEYLDGRLDQGHQELVARRLAGCPACQEELNTLQNTVSVLRSLPHLPLPRSFTLATAPSPVDPAKLIRKPAPMVMKMPAWAYGSAASLAGLALALMLSAEAAGLASPASFETTGQTTGQATATPEDAAVAKESPVEAQVAAPEMADQAAAPADSSAAPAPQTALPAHSCPAPVAPTPTGCSATASRRAPRPGSSRSEPPATTTSSACTSATTGRGCRKAIASTTASGSPTRWHGSSVSTARPSTSRLPMPKTAARSSRWSCLFENFDAPMFFTQM